MNWEALRSTVEKKVRQRLESDSSGHDWWHIDRVRRTAVCLAKEENADPVTVELAALLHDVADWKLHDGTEESGLAMLDQWMIDWDVPASMRESVLTIIREISFKGAQVATPMSSVEGAVVQDADRLDAIGAIGIGRAFAFGGSRGRAMHDPDNAPEMHTSFDDYKKKSGPTINHFYEKLLLLRDRMNTNAARALADHRHLVMEEFLQEFMTEWNFPADRDAHSCDSH